MKPLLDDFVRHQAWADAESWRAFESLPAALTDAVLVRRLHHLHLVQHGFLWAARADGSEFAFTNPADFPSGAALKAYGRQATDGFVTLADAATDDTLNREIRIPWFADPPLTLTVSEALAQAIMHSQWHRGQNAARFRELGGEPPTIDFIVWLWKGRPAARW
jgi:uncharacterized damage-inducible protein DinB